MWVYHYTKEVHFEQILKDGLIKVTAFLTPFPSLVWLTSEPFVPNFCRPQDNSLSPPRFVDVAYHRFIFDSADPLLSNVITLDVLSMVIVLKKTLPLELI